MKTSAQEECGVWLDTVQLKGKAKQKRLARPISKLLNPFAGGGGYSLAVALNFTQTKMEMPKTKQSSISTFFMPQGRGLTKKSTSEVTNMHPLQPSSSSNSSTCAVAASTSVTSGTKRRREIDLEVFDLCKSEVDVDHEWKCEDVTEPEAAQWWEEQEAEEQFEEVNPPQRKRRITGVSSLPDDSQPPPQAWSQDPLLTYSQFSESEDSTANQKNTAQICNSEPSFLNTLQSEEVFGINMEGRTSTQKSFKHFHSSQTSDDKENSIFLPFKSPKKLSTASHGEPLSNHKWTEPKTALPRKHSPACMLKKADKEEGLESPIKWTKSSRSPLKKQASQLSCRVADEDTLATLFTQDSEGFRVIAHRGLQASPLKDQSNIRSGKVRPNDYRSVVEDEMLFTQDSQGNLVIKH